MTLSRAQKAVLCALPGLVLGVAGLRHPMHLNAATAHTWWTLHVAGLFVFPLVGVALMALVWGRRDVVAVLVVLTSFVYATAYSALDVLSGIGAGYVTDHLPAGAPRPDEVRSLFAIGTPLGRIGSVALILAALLVTFDALTRVGAKGAVGLLAVLGAVLVHNFHIYPPWGSTGIALVGLGTGGLARRWPREPVSDARNWAAQLKILRDGCRVRFSRVPVTVSDAEG